MEVYPYNIGCEPSPSVPAEVLMQDGRKTYLLFFAVSREVQENGFLKDLGVAIVECVNASSAKMGYPNDEGILENPLWEYGLSEIVSSIVEVRGSPWLTEIHGRRNRSGERIWGGRGMTSEPVPTQKHFIVTLKDRTFECIADELRVVKFVSSYDLAFEFVISEFKKR